MSRRKKKKSTGAKKIEAKQSSSSLNLSADSMSDPQTKRWALLILLGLALPFAAYFITSGDNDGLYVTIMLAGSLGITIWALPNIKLGLTGVFLYTQPLLIYIANTDYNYTKTIYSVVFIGLLGLIWAIDWLREKNPEITLTKLALPGAGIIAVAVLSLINSRAFLADFQHVVYLIYFVFFTLFLINILRSYDDIKLVLRVILLAGVGASVYALLQYFGWVLGKPGADNGTSAVISSFGNKNYMAGFLSYIFVPGLLLLFKSEVLSDRLYAITSLSILTLALLTATSESAWLALLLSMGVFLIALWSTGEIKEFRKQLGWGILFSIQLAFFVLFFLVLSALIVYESPVFLSSMSQAFGKFSVPAWIVVGSLIMLPVIGWILAQFDAAHPRRALIGVGVLVVVSVGFLLSPMGSGVVGDLTRFLSQNTVQTRAQDWGIGFEMFKENPIIGTGIGDYKREFLEYKDDFLASPGGEGYNSYIRRADQAHNEYVQILSEMGILGILATFALIGFLIWSFVTRVRAATSSTARWMLTVLFAGLVAFIADAFFSFPLHLPANALVLVLLLGAMHARALGESSLKFKLSRSSAVASVTVLFVVVAVVSVFAYRDWQADLSLDRGQYLYQIESDLEGALDELQRNERLAFAASKVYHWLGLIKYQQSQAAAASGAVEEMENLRAESEAYFKKSIGPFLNESTYFYLAVIEQEKRNYELSLEYLETLLAINPAPSLMPNILQLEAVNIYNLGESEEGIEKLEELAMRYPTEPAMNLTLARMYAEQWDEREDITFCERGREAVDRGLVYIRSRLARLDRFLNPEEDTNISYNKYHSWQSEKSTLENIRSQLNQLTLNLRCG